MAATRRSPTCSPRFSPARTSAGRSSTSAASASRSSRPMRRRAKYQVDLHDRRRRQRTDDVQRRAPARASPTRLARPGTSRSHRRSTRMPFADPQVEGGTLTWTFDSPAPTAQRFTFEAYPGIELGPTETSAKAQLAGAAGRRQRRRPTSPSTGNLEPSGLDNPQPIASDEFVLSYVSSSDRRRRLQPPGTARRKPRHDPPQPSSGRLRPRRLRAQRPGARPACGRHAAPRRRGGRRPGRYPDARDRRAAAADVRRRPDRRRQDRRRHLRQPRHPGRRGQVLLAGRSRSRT